MIIHLPYGRTGFNLDIPDANLAGVIEPEEINTGKSENDILIESISNPVNSDALSDLVKKGDKVSIIVSDATRTTPAAKMLPFVLAELKKGGVAHDNITVISALGSHRKQTESEKKAILGGSYGRVRFIEHDITDCEYIGTTGRGTPVEIFRKVLDSDVVVCTGSIEFHYYAGYTGGAKSILPGVSSKRSIDHNHSLMLDPEARAGNISGPVRADIDEAGELFGIDFILNTIPNSKNEIVYAVSGNPIDAHRKGAACVDSMYKTGVELADIVIVSAGGAPKDINIYQSHKAIENAKGAVREGGAIILVAQCPEGYGNPVYEQWLNECVNKRDAIDRFRRGFVMGGHKAALVASLSEKIDLYLISSLPDDVVKKAYFIPARTPDEALGMALKNRKDGTVMVMPHGNLTLAANS